MLIFLDTEFTDYTDPELISIGMVGEDARHTLYLEVKDFDRSKCNSFVEREVLPHLGKTAGSEIMRAELQASLKAWFATLPRSLRMACDSLHDKALLHKALGGVWPQNVHTWPDLSPLINIGVFHHAVVGYHNDDRPWHHALYDAHAHRIGWLAWMDKKNDQEARKLAHKQFKEQKSDDEMDPMWVDKRVRQALSRARVQSGERTPESMFFIPSEIARKLKIIDKPDEF